MGVGRDEREWERWVGMDGREWLGMGECGRGWR